MVLQIRPEQFSSMIDASRRGFVSDCMPALREEFPQLWVNRSEPQIEEMLLTHCEFAQAFRLDTAEGVYALFGFRLRLGLDFPTLPEQAWAREILGRELSTESERIAALEQHLWCFGPDDHE